MNVCICSLSLILFHLFLLAANAPTNGSAAAPSSEYHLNPDGSFQYSILENDYTKLVKGIMKNFSGKEALVQDGSYSYTTPDLFNVHVEFVTNNNGVVATKTRLNNISGVTTTTPKPTPSRPTTFAPYPTVPRTIHPKTVLSFLGG